MRQSPGHPTRACHRRRLEKLRPELVVAPSLDSRFFRYGFSCCDGESSCWIPVPMGRSDWFLQTIHINIVRYDSRKLNPITCCKHNSSGFCRECFARRRFAKEDCSLACSGQAATTCRNSRIRSNCSDLNHFNLSLCKSQSCPKQTSCKTTKMSSSVIVKSFVNSR